VRFMETLYIHPVVSPMPPYEEFGSPCVCGCENFERVIVERVVDRPVITDLLACVECRCVYYSPLPRPAPAPPRGGPQMPSGVVTNPPGLLKSWGGVAGTYRPHEQSPEELQAIKDAAARANKSKPKR